MAEPTALDNLLTLDDLADAKIDAATLGEYTNENKTITSRLGASYPSVPKQAQMAVDAIETILQSGGHKGFATLAAAQAVQASLPINTIVEVINDPANNGLYLWNGATLTKSGYDIKTDILSRVENSFSTHAAMMADTTLQNGAYVVVVDDTDDKNGHYQKRGGVWTYLKYNPASKAFVTDAATAAKNSAIEAASTDATNKANAAKDAAVIASNNYTNTQMSNLDLGTNVLSGQEIFDKALKNPSLRFAAIWDEYKKPIYHIGNRIIVDAVGAELSVVKEELVFTIKTTKENQSFYFPKIGDWGSDVANVDWGDGTSNDIFGNTYVHKYAAPVGSVFTVRVTGMLRGFGYTTGGVGVNDSNFCIVSIDKNTLPKVTKEWNFKGMTNLASICDGALSSFSGESLSGLRMITGKKITSLSRGVFWGLANVKNISSLMGFEDGVPSIKLPDGIFDVFTNATDAEFLLQYYKNELPIGVLDKMTNLSNARGLFYTSKPTNLSSDVFKNQDKLKIVTNCFYAVVSNADALELYNDMKRGVPTETLGCFKFASGFKNLTQVPAEWK